MEFAEFSVRNAACSLYGRMPFELASQFTEDTVAFLAEIARRISTVVCDCGDGLAPRYWLAHTGARRAVNSA